MSQSGVKNPADRGVRPRIVKRNTVGHANNRGSQATTSTEVPSENTIDTLAAANEIIHFDAQSNDVSICDSLNKPVNNLAWLRGYGIYLLGACIIAAIAFLLYGNRLTTRYFMPQNAPTVVVQQNSNTNVEQELEKITSLIIQDREWNFSRINKLINYWKLLDTPERSRVADTVWYQHFVFVLQNKLMDLQNSAGFYEAKNTASENPLIGLATTMGISVPVANPRQRDGASQRLEDIVHEVASELKKHEAEQATRTTEGENAGGVNDTILMARTKQEPEHLAAKTARQGPLVGNNTRDTSLQSEEGATTVQLNQILQQYVYAYEQGNTSSLLHLFGERGEAEDDPYIRQLKSNFERQFAISVKRRLALGVSHWTRKGEKIVGKGDYNAMLTLNDKSGTQSIKAKLNLEMQRIDNRLQIVNFQLLDRNVNVVTPELSLSKSRANKNVRQPTASELQDMVTRFISAYEAGDLELLISLFAENAKTNDKNSLDDIVKDYTALFSSTSERQIFIQDLDWSYNNNRAKGNGKINTVVFANNDNKLQQLNGKIQIVAKKIDDKVLITHLYHILRRD